jgi:putative flippase GtrA
LNFNKDRYIKSITVGALGVLVNYLFYSCLRNIIYNDVAWFIGILISATSNYILAENWTFRAKGDDV